MIESVLSQTAHERAVAGGLPYSGAMTPPEAYNFLQTIEKAVLVDVRTKPELHYVGRVPDATEIEWMTWPDMEVNEDFINELKASGLSEEDPILFICRSGVRSHNAALTAHANGFHQVYNVIEGFEGDPDANQRRSKVNGWRYHGLPWYQS